MGLHFSTKNAYLEHFTNSIEEPSMGIDLLLVLGLQDQDNLDRHEVVRVIVGRQDQLRSSIDRKLRSILRDTLLNLGCVRICHSAYLKDVGNGVLAVNLLFHDSVLVHANRGENIQDGFVHGLETVDNQGDGDPLPTGATFLCMPLPVFGLLGLAYVADIQHNAMECACVKGLVFVIGRDCDQNIGRPSPLFLAKGPSVLLIKIIWIARRRGVAHVPKRVFGVTGKQ